MKFILGKKLNMTQVWEGDKCISVTKVLAGPCVISQVKDIDSDNYKALQLAFGNRKLKNITKPLRFHLKKAGISAENARCVREFRVDEITPEMKVGSIIDISTFAKGDIVDVIGVSKGKGFQGVVKRHGFAGSKKTHGNKDQLRASGSIGALGPAQVFKGTKMGGRMGGDRVTVKNLEIISIDEENNILYIKGAIPGGRNGLLMIRGAGDLLIKEANAAKTEPKSETDESKLEAEKAEDEVKDEAKLEGEKKLEEEVEEEAEKKEETKDEVDVSEKPSVEAEENKEAEKSEISKESSEENQPTKDDASVQEEK